MPRGGLLCPEDSVRRKVLCAEEGTPGTWEKHTSITVVFLPEVMDVPEPVLVVPAAGELVVSVKAVTVDTVV